METLSTNEMGEIVGGWKQQQGKYGCTYTPDEGGGPVIIETGKCKGAPF